MLKEDSENLQPTSQEIPKFVRMLDKSDFLVRAYMNELQLRYKGREVLQYLLIDGEFKGIVIGHWGFGLYDIDDVIVELEEEEAELRKNEILDAVRTVYSSGSNPIVRYNGRVY